MLGVLGLYFFLSAVGAKPNILHIIVDDLRPEISPYEGLPFFTGLQEIQAPNIEELASGSVVFRRAYCQYPLCTPSRTSFLTGRRPTSSGVLEHEQYFRDEHSDYVTLPHFFKSKGYASLGTGKVFHPLGNESSLSFNSFHEIPTAIRLIYERNVTTPTMAVSDEKKNRELLPDEAVLDMALEHLRSFHRGDYSEENFYLAVGFTKPHLPWVAPQRFFDLYDIQDILLPTVNKDAPLDCPNATWPHGTSELLKHYADVSELPNAFRGSYNISVPDDFAKEYRRGYFACVSFVDSLIGVLLQEIHDLGLQDNTAIVLHSDHGYNLGEHGAWGKQTMFEMTNHVPLMFKVPGIAPREVDEVVELVDLFPTLADIAGLSNAVARCHPTQPTPLCHEGRSLVELIEGKDRTRTDEAVFFTHQHGVDAQDVGRLLGQSVLTEKGRLTKWFLWEHREMIGAMYAEEMYDHTTDPKEMVNVIDSGKHEDLREDLNGLLV